MDPVDRSFPIADPRSRRLGSWKEIAAYVGRDVRTVSRWEKERGFPVRRLPGGSGSSVFAYTEEIDAWLRGRADVAPDRPPSDRRASTARLKYVAAGIALAAAVVAGPLLWGKRLAVTNVEARGTELVALSGGVRLWSYDVKVPIHFALPSQQYVVDDPDGDGVHETFAALTLREGAIDTSRLLCLDDAGGLRWQYTPEDRVTFADQTYAGPWQSGPVAVQRQSRGGRIFWTTHHYTWWPALITMLDDHGTPLAAFIHPGWITSIQPLPSDRVVATGINNEFESDVIALLDDDSWPGAAPPAAKPEFACRECPSGRPVRYFVVPPTEMNMLVGMPRLQAHIHVLERTIEVRTYQNGTDAHGGELILEFTPDMTPVRARMSDAYWTWHRQMEAEGRLRHSADMCPEHRGIELRDWRRGAGWTTVFVPGDRPTSR